jgi:phosphatidylserine/phosphatidylglycerophosphate/cardiolipin synthase-like enzyme
MPDVSFPIGNAQQLVKQLPPELQFEAQARIDAAKANNQTTFQLPDTFLKSISPAQLAALQQAGSGTSSLTQSRGTPSPAVVLNPRPPPGAPPVTAQQGGFWSWVHTKVDGAERFATHVEADVQKDQADFKAQVQAIDAYQGPPTILRTLREWALDTPTQALAALKDESTKAQLTQLTDAQLAQILSALDVNHLDKAKVPSAELLKAVSTVLTTHLSGQDKQAVQDWLTQCATARSPADIGYPNISFTGMGQIRAITTRMMNDGHILQGRLEGLDPVIYEHLQARRIEPGNVKGTQDFILAVTGAKPDPGTAARLMDYPGFELDPAVQAPRDSMLEQLRNWPKNDLDNPKAQKLAERLRGAVLGPDGKPPRVGVKDAAGKWYPLVDFNGPGCTLQPLPPGILTRLPNAVYPNILADMNTAIDQAQAVKAAADKAGRPVADNEKVPIWLHDFAFQSDGTGWAVAAMLVKAAKAGADVRVQYDPVGSANSNIKYDGDDVKHLTTDSAVYQYLKDNGVQLLPFPDGKGSKADEKTKDWLSHLKKDLIGNVAYVGGAGNVGDEYSVQSMFHDAMTRITGPGVASTAEGLANYWKYSMSEQTRRMQRDNPQLTGSAFDAAFSKQFGSAKPISDDFLKAFRARNATPIVGAQTDPYNSVVQVDHWGGHQDENGKETMIALAENAQRRFVISVPYPTDKFFSESAIKAAASMKAYQDKQGIPAAQQTHSTVIVPAFNDVSVEYWGMLDKYESMIKAGVDVYEFAGDPMLHNKFEIADDFWEHGSHNGDWRSRYGNNENIAFQHDQAGADSMNGRAENLKAQGHKLTLAEVQARKGKVEEYLKAKGVDLTDPIIKY